MALPYTDTFTQNTGADQALATYNASWVVDSGSFSVADATDDVQATTGGTENVAYWSGDTPGADQAVEFTLASVTAGVYPGAIARRSSAGNYYTLYVGSGEYYVSRYDGAAENVLVGPVAVTTAANDVFRLEVSGVGATVTLKAFRNGTQLGSDISDTAGTRKLSGSGGIICYSASGSARITTFKVENLGATASVDQEGARFGVDDGSESAHTWLAAQDAGASTAIGTAALIRLLLNGTGDAASAAYTLRYQKNGAGGYVAVPVGATVPEAYSQPTWGAVGTAASGTNTANPSFPTGISASTSKLLAVCTGRSDVADSAFTAPAGWTSLGQLEGGTGTFGVDTGTRRVGFFLKDTTTGSETGTTGNFGYTSGGATNSTLRVSVFRIEVPAGYTLDTEFVSGSDTTNGTGYSAAASANATFDANRLVLIGTAQNIDTGTATSRSITATGITFGTLTNRADTAVTNGNAHRHILNSVPVSSGSGTVAPTFAYTISASGSGPTGFLVLRARLPAVTNQIYIAASANIAAGGEATTARLTAPSGKTTSDFVTGRRWDDENGTDTIDLTTDDYTEVEWCVNTQSPAANGDYFDFRVYAGASALDTYTVTPRLTLGAPAPSITGTSSATPAEGSTLTITGTNFQAAQGTGGVAIGGVGQVETSWSDTSVQVTVSKGTSIKNGVAVNVVLTDDDAVDSNAFALTSIQPPSGWAFVNIGTPNTTAANRLTTSGGGDLASGDQVEYGNIVGTGSVTVFDDGTFVADGGVTAFDFRAFTTADGWGSVATQTLASGTVVSVDGSAAAPGQAGAAAAALVLSSASSQAVATASAARLALASSSAAGAAAPAAAAPAAAVARADASAGAAGQGSAGGLSVLGAAGAGHAAEQAAAPTLALQLSAGAAQASSQASGAAGALAASSAAAAAAASAAAAPAAVASASAAASAAGQASGDTGATVVVAVDGVATGPSHAAADAASIHAVSAAAGAAGQATADTGARTVLAVDASAQASGAAAAGAGAIAASTGGAASPAAAAAGAVALRAVDATSSAAQQATAEASSSTIIAVDGFAGAAAPAAAQVVAIAAAAASVTAPAQASGAVLATAAVDASAGAPGQASADAAGRQTVAVDAIASAPQQAASPQGEEAEPEPVPQPGGFGRLVTPSFPLPKRRRTRIVAVDGVSCGSAQAAASVQALFAVAGAAASAAQLGTASLPLGAMVADQWLEARMQELHFERNVLAHL